MKGYVSMYECKAYQVKGEKYNNSGM